MVMLPWIYFSVIRYLKFHWAFKVSLLSAFTAVWLVVTNISLNYFINHKSWSIITSNDSSIAPLLIVAAVISAVFSAVGIAFILKSKKYHKTY